MKHDQEDVLHSQLQPVPFFQVLPRCSTYVHLRLAEEKEKSLQIDGS